MAVVDRRTWFEVLGPSEGWSLVRGEAIGRVAVLAS